MLQDVIDKITSLQRKMPRGLNEDEILILKEKVKSKMNYELPEDYLLLLRQINCLCFNGFYIYGMVNNDILDNFPRLQTCDFLFMNDEISYEEIGNEYIIFGDSTFDYCAYSKINKCYVHLDMGTSEIVGFFNSFSDMVEAFFIRAIN